MSKRLQDKADPCVKAFDEWAKGRYSLDTEDGRVAYERAFNVWLAAWEARGLAAKTSDSAP